MHKSDTDHRPIILWSYFSVPLILSSSSTAPDLTLRNFGINGMGIRYKLTIGSHAQLHVDGYMHVDS